MFLHLPPTYMNVKVCMSVRAGILYQSFTILFFKKINDVFFPILSDLLVSG